MIADVLNQAVFWHWWVLAALLMAVEIFAPTTLFLWTGISAIVIGIIVLLVPELPWQVQVLAFAILSVASVVLWKRYAPKRLSAADVTLNDRTRQYIGETYTLETPIVNGVGRVRIGDTHWNVHGEDLPAGTKVRVVGADGVALKVERARTSVLG